jgi:arginine-tRNA-protein transferase
MRRVHSPLRPRRPQFFYTTTPLPCPYLAGRTERKIVTELTGPDSEALHDRLSRAGFRRSHNIAYSPVCPGCRSCIPIRVAADRFRPNRTQRRLIARNADLAVRAVPARATAEQFSLFQRYQQSRHGGGDMSAMGFYDYRAMVEDTPITTGMVEFRDAAGKLLGGCLTDWLSDGLSAVYSFYAPDQDRRSLGTYAVLWLVAEARRLGRPFVYLGYWVPESPKMAYKAGFRPAETLRHGEWRPLDEPAGAELVRA